MSKIWWHTYLGIKDHDPDWWKHLDPVIVPSRRYWTGYKPKGLLERIRVFIWRHTHP